MTNGPAPLGLTTVMRASSVCTARSVSKSRSAPFGPEMHAYKRLIVVSIASASALLIALYDAIRPGAVAAVIVLNPAINPNPTAKPETIPLRENNLCAVLSISTPLLCCVLMNGHDGVCLSRQPALIHILRT